MAEIAEYRSLKYPARAVAVIVLAWLACGAMVLTGTLFVALMLPALPLFVGLILGGACLVGSAYDYARSRAIVGPSASPPIRLSASHEHSPRQRPLATPVS
jgi:hypothetical protein